MITVAIIGVLAALAIFGVTRYLASAKTSETKNTLGALSRGAQMAYEREQSGSQLLADGQTSAAISHDVCGTSNYSIAAIPLGKKTQPAAASFANVGAGNSNNVGYLCLRFSISDATYYRYGYVATRQSALPAGETAGNAVLPSGVTAPAGVAFTAFGEGDLNANGITSSFAISGQVDTTNGALKVETQLTIQNELE
jgi:type IV pilus assembly protein PilA